MATQAHAQKSLTEDKARFSDHHRIKIIRSRYVIDTNTSDEDIFFYSRVNYYGAHQAREKAVTEHARFIATGELPDHMIRCSDRDVSYHPHSMRNPELPNPKQ